MHSKILKILLSLLLVCSFLLVGCSKEDTQTEDTSPSVSTEEDDKYVKDQLPDDLDYGGEEISILNWKSEVVEFGCTEIAGEVVNDACYQRDTTVNERLGVKIKYREEPGGPDNGQVDSFCALVQNASAAGEYYDFVAAYGRAGATLSHQGYLADLLAIEDTYLNFENPWWPAGLLEELSVGKSMYLASGDITPTVVQLAQGMWYNVDMMSDYGLVDPYEHIGDNTWTLDTFYEYIKNAEAAATSEDVYAVATTYYDVASFLHGSGVRLMVRDNSGYPTMNPDLFGEKAVNIMDRLGSWAKDHKFLVTDGTDFEGTGGDKYSLASYAVFASGEALFVNANINASKYFAQHMTQKYSIVPMPKYDGTQETYLSTLHNSISTFSMMRGQPKKTLTMLSAVMECMSSEGYRKVIPAVYDVCLTSRYINTVTTAEMLELISDNVTYDFGRLYSMAQTNYLCDRIGRIIQQKPGRSENGLSWTSFGTSQGESTANSFNKIIDNLRNLA